MTRAILLTAFGLLSQAVSGSAAQPSEPGAVVQAPLPRKVEAVNEHYHGTVTEVTKDSLTIQNSENPKLLPKRFAAAD